MVAVGHTAVPVVEDIFTWIQCFSRYTAAMAKEYPGCTPGFMSHLLTVMKAYCEAKQPEWQEYDVAFREKWPRWARKTGQGWMCPSTTSCVVPVQNKWGPQKRRGQVRRGSGQQRGVRKCAGSTMMANAPSRIASSLIAASGVWETTQDELAVVDPGETSPDHSLTYWEAIAECSGDASESNSCQLLFEILS